MTFLLAMVSLLVVAYLLLSTYLYKIEVTHDNALAILEQLKEWEVLDKADIGTSVGTPNPELPPLDPVGPYRRMLVEIQVSADFEKRLDNQWMVEREIQADRWSWKWADNQ